MFQLAFPVMLKARDAASAELERLRLMMSRRRSTTRKKGSPHARWMGHELVVAGGAERSSGVRERGNITIRGNSRIADTYIGDLQGVSSLLPQ